MSKKDKKFISSTIGMLVKHHNQPSSKLIRCQFYSVENGVELHAVSGYTLSRITNIPTVLITSEQFSDRDYDHYDDQVEFWWAMKLLGCDIAVNEYSY